MGYKAGNSVRKWHVRNYLDSIQHTGFSDEYISYTLLEINAHIPGTENITYRRFLAFLECLEKLDLGRIEKRRSKVRYYVLRKANQPEYITYFVFKYNRLKIKEFYQEFRGKRRVLTLTEK